MKNNLSIMLVLGVLSTCPAGGEEAKIVVDSRPEMGVPAEALAQEHEAPKKGQKTFVELTDGIIKTVRIRYYDKEKLATEELATDYVRKILKDKTLDVAGFQIWSEALGEPEVECRIEFTTEHQEQVWKKQREQPVKGKIHHREGCLLIWPGRACFRDAAGRWWFVYPGVKANRVRPTPAVQE